MSLRFNILSLHTNNIVAYSSVLKKILNVKVIFYRIFSCFYMIFFINYSKPKKKKISSILKYLFFQIKEVKNDHSVCKTFLLSYKIYLLFRFNKFILEFVTKLYIKKNIVP